MHSADAPVYDATLELYVEILVEGGKTGVHFSNF
jgi:hypothetical protein